MNQDISDKAKTIVVNRQADDGKRTENERTSGLGNEAGNGADSADQEFFRRETAVDGRSTAEKKPAWLERVNQLEGQRRLALIGAGVAFQVNLSVGPVLPHLRPSQQL